MHYPHIVERKQKIGQLQDEGKTRQQIAQELGLTLYQVDYLLMSDGRRKKKRLFLTLDSERGSYSYLTERVNSWRKRSPPEDREDFGLKEVLARFGSPPTCYLTGAPIDLRQSGSYSLDHITPLSRGGKSNLDNLGLTTTEANQMKDAIPLTRFIELCEIIVFRHKEGYLKEFIS